MTEREAKAKEADRAALGLNPFLFKSFESLCNRGPDHPSPYKVFNVENLATLNFSVGVNQVSVLLHRLLYDLFLASCAVLIDISLYSGFFYISTRYKIKQILEKKLEQIILKHNNFIR